MRRSLWVGFGIMCLGIAATTAPAGGKKAETGDKKPDDPLLILDAQGKEVKLKGWHLTAGTRRVPTGENPGKKGPDHVEFRDEHSTTYLAGILTLIPVPSLRKLDYDNEKKSVTAVVAVAGDRDVTLTGSTKFAGINRLTIEGDADLGDLGYASVKFQGGNPKGGVTGVRFPSPQPVAAAKGSPATVIADDKEKSRHTALDLTAVYHLADGSDRIMPLLHFKKTVKIELSKIASLRHIEAEDKKQTSYEFEVTLTSGEKHTLTLLTKVDLDGGKSATLVGLLGRVAVGYKLFPAHTIAELRMDQGEKKNK